MRILYKVILLALLYMPAPLENLLFEILYPVYALTHRKRAWGRVNRHLESTGLIQKTSPKKVFRSLYTNYLDSLRYLCRLPKALKEVRFEREELIREPLKNGTPVVAMGIHTGAFEIMHRLLTRYSEHVYLFTHSFKDKALTRLLHDIRKTPGLEERETSAVARTIRDFFKNRGIIAMLVDQATEGRGNPVELLGRPAELFLRMPLKMLSMGAGIVTFRIFRTSEGHTVRFETFYPPKSSPEETAKAIAAEASAWISERPDEWTWNYHRNFTRG